jgi:hypothetical protein
VAIVAQNPPLLVYTPLIFDLLLTVADHTGVGFVAQRLSLSRFGQKQSREDEER